MFVALLGRDGRRPPGLQHLYTWFQVGGLDVGMDLLYDPLSALFLLLITGVGSLIHVYSIGYMAHDPRRRRFFGYLNLFVAAMLMLVLSENYLGLFLGWEGVGLASYLLIGFWQHKPTAAAAAKKAFVINRVGDMGLVAGDHDVLRPLRLDELHRDQRERRQRVRDHGDDPRPAAPARRVRQVRAVPAAGLAARRDGGPDPGVGADPRGDHGDRRRLPDRPVQLRLRPRAGRPDRGGRRRGDLDLLGRLDRLREGRHQEGAGRLDDEPDRLHDAGRRPRRRRATRSRSSTC